MKSKPSSEGTADQCAREHAQEVKKERREKHNDAVDLLFFNH